jgi:LPS-assembly lipoprotein
MRTLTLILLAALLTACGFQLRGSQPLPFTSMHFAVADSSLIGAGLKRQVRALGSTQIVDTPQEAQAIFAIIGEAKEKQILSVSGTGRVREFQLRYRLAFKVYDLKGREFIPPSEIVLARTISFSDEYVLAKEREEELLYRDMESDMVQQLMRRLAAAKVEG